MHLGRDHSTANCCSLNIQLFYCLICGIMSALMKHHHMFSDACHDHCMYVMYVELHLSPLTTRISEVKHFLRKCSQECQNQIILFILYMLPFLQHIKSHIKSHFKLSNFISSVYVCMFKSLGWYMAHPDRSCVCLIGVLPCRLRALSAQFLPSFLTDR